MVVKHVRRQRLSEHGVPLLVSQLSGSFCSLDFSSFFAKSLGALAPFGHLIRFGAASSTATALDVKNLYEADHTLTGVLLSGWFRRGSAVSDALTRLLTWVAAGDLRIPTTFPPRTRRGGAPRHTQPQDDRQSRTDPVAMTRRHHNTGDPLS